VVQAQQPAQQVGPGVQLTGRRTKANKQQLLQLLETYRSYKPGEKALTHVGHVEKPQGQLLLPLIALLSSLVATTQQLAQAVAMSLTRRLMAEVRNLSVSC